MCKANVDIHNAIRTANLKYWQVAHLYGLNDGNFSRKLRYEFSPEEKKRIFDIIEELKNER